MYLCFCNTSTCVYLQALYFLEMFLKRSIHFLFLAVVGLCCSIQAFSSCSERRLLFVAACWLLLVVASVVELGVRLVGAVVGLHGLFSTGSVVWVHGLSCSLACEILLDQGLNWCSLHCRCFPWTIGEAPCMHFTNICKTACAISSCFSLLPSALF